MFEYKILVTIRNSDPIKPMEAFQLFKELLEDEYGIDEVLGEIQSDSKEGMNMKDRENCIYFNMCNSCLTPNCSFWGDKIGSDGRKCPCIEYKGGNE